MVRRHSRFFVKQDHPQSVPLFRNFQNYRDSGIEMPDRSKR